MKSAVWPLAASIADSIMEAPDARVDVDTGVDSDADADDEGRRHLSRSEPCPPWALMASASSSFSSVS